MTASPTPEPVPARPRVFLVAQDSSVDPASAGPLEFDWVVEQLDARPDIEVQRHLRSTTLRTFNLADSITDEVVVAAMPDAVAAELALHPQVLVEEDLPLLPQIRGPVLGNPLDLGLFSPFGTSTSWTLQLTGRGNQPIAGATVYLYGSGAPVQGRTDAEGKVTLTLLNETDATLRALYVNPLSDYWSLWQNRPQLRSGQVTVVPLQPLSETFPGFPSAERLGWGQLAMRLDQVPEDRTGPGIKIAVVDSGAAVTTHPDLAAIHDGVDLTGDTPNDVQWRDDTIAHGSHCSGVIAGARNGGGIRGFAPDAEVHEARIFPGGRISSLISAIDYCIEHDIDVVNMSLGTGGSSQIMLQKLARAKEAGVACIVAAGNTGGGVQFPGTSPDVLTVAAIGQDGSFPPSSYHAQQRWADGRTDQGYFSAQFSCHGPEIDVCGPGVAIVSSVPPSGYAAWDGTSMATPHVTGLAALVLAHHPDFRDGGLQLRGAARVDRLFELLRGSATPLDFGDLERSGAGLPDAPRALGLVAGSTPAGRDAAEADAITAALAQLAAHMVAAGIVQTTLQPALIGHPFTGGNGSGGGTVDGFLGRFLAQQATSAIAIRRSLAELAARMTNAGLRADATPPTAVV